MATIEEQIKEVEEEIRKTPYNKASQHHIGKLKAKLSKLKEKAFKSASVGKAQSLGYGLKKSGDATVILVGFPSAGKSTLLNQLTNAESVIGAYEFTTLTVVPGAMDYKGAKVQIFDVPGLIEGAASGKGRGKEVLAVIRNADLIVLLADINKPEQIEKMKVELFEASIRLDEKPPSITIKTRTIGGVQFDKSSKVDLTRETIVGILAEYAIFNAHVVIQKPVTIDQFIDVVTGNRIYVPSLVVLNKMDTVDKIPNIKHDIAISADKGINLDEFKVKMFDKLELIRIYMRPQGGKTDTDEPMVIKKGMTVGDVCDKVHKTFRRRFRYAQIWGKSAKHDGQHVGLNHVFKDEDVLTLILKE